VPGRFLRLKQAAEKPTKALLVLFPVDQVVLRFRALREVEQQHFIACR